MRIETYLPGVASWLRKIAANAAPREACGVLTRSQQIVEIPNRSPRPDVHFDAGPLHEIEAREGELLAIWHTHPEDGPPSPQDRYSCAATFLPWIVAGPSKLWVMYQEPRPYGGRDFVYGSDDCLGLITDWQAQERSVFLPWFERPPEGWWHSEGPSPYLQHVEACGFAALPFLECGAENLLIGDILLIQLAARRVNHAAIYLGGGYLLHHVYGELSRPDQFDGRWQRMARYVCRPKEPKC